MLNYTSKGGGMVPAQDVWVCGKDNNNNRGRDKGRLVSAGPYLRMMSIGSVSSFTMAEFLTQATR